MKWRTKLKRIKKTLGKFHCSSNGALSEDLFCLNFSFYHIISLTAFCVYYDHTFSYRLPFLCFMLDLALMMFGYSIPLLWLQSRSV